MLAYLRQNPARVYGFAVAALALVSVYFTVPTEPILGLVAAALALFGGEAVQKAENSKTEAALWTLPPGEDDLA